MRQFFFPESIALIGASEGTEKIGGKTLDAIVSHGYKGRLYPINASKARIGNLVAYPDIGSVNDSIDLAIVAIPAPHVLEAVRQCAAKGVPYVIVVSSGFNEAGPEGRRLQAALLELARETGIRINGPNAEGLFTTAISLAATFSPAIHIEKGEPDSARQIGIVSQSGGLGFGFYNRGRRDNLNFNHIVSVGNQVDLELNDYAEFILEQPNTAVLMMYVESFVNPGRFVSLMQRAADLRKPIVMVKVGRSKAGGQAAASHTGALASPVKVVDAVLDAGGVLRADDQAELLDIAAGLIHYPALKGNRVAVVSPSGGTAVWLTDALQAAGFELPAIDEDSQARMREYIPSFGSTGNPVDITAQTTTHGYAATLEILGKADYIDAIVLAASFAHEKRLISEGQQIAELSRSVGKPVLLYSYTIPSDGSMRRLKALGLHCFVTMRGCVLALAAMRDYAAFQALHQSPSSGLPSRLPLPPNARAQALDILAQSPHTIIAEHPAKRLLASYGIDVPKEHVAKDLNEALQFASQIGYPVALKVHSADLAHKTEAGAVVLGVKDASVLSVAYERVLASARSYDATAVLDGVLIQPMSREGVEMIAGLSNDEQFGPMVLVGTGGIFAEVLDDVVMAPAPLSVLQAHALIGRLKGAKLLDGVRGRPPADRQALATFLVKLSHMAVDLAQELAEFDVNPVFVHPNGKGLTIVDALGVKAAK
jgi:acetyltransferase